MEIDLGPFDVDGEDLSQDKGTTASGEHIIHSQ